MKKIRMYIEIKGIVQGVGFRPYIYNLAEKNNLYGWVNNTANGVLIDVEGEKNNIDNFIFEIKNNPPPLANVESIFIKELKNEGFNKFYIKKTNDNEINKTLISPDYSICEQCISDIFNENNRRFRYSFTNCTNCGPRFSIIKSLPYDREYTTMNEFKMCDKCKEEYENPSDRRFHAQPNGCPVCGPRLIIKDNLGCEIEVNDHIKYSIELLSQGYIMAIKGIGGYNLSCDGKNKEAIDKLRKRKKRPTKPLALMMKNIETIKKYCKVTKGEEELLNNNKRPIVLLEKNKEFHLPNNIAPNNNRVGVMLPYTPMHYLLMENNMDILVMTSGNYSGESIIHDDIDAVKKLNKVADYFLYNNRKINMPIDDSVVIYLNEKEQVIRPGRGYAPDNIPISTKKEIIALGTELKNTLAISNKSNVFFSPYIGDLNNVNTLNRYERNINHICNIYKIKPEIVAYDLHPSFNYRNLGFVIDKEKQSKIVVVQHHHGHIVSCMAENNIYEKVIGIAFDGTGYGIDKKIWGGEFLICDRKKFKRVAHLEYFKLPAGDSCIKEPWKIAISLLFLTFGEQYEKYLPNKIKNKNYKLIYNILKKNINCIDTSSIGRLFDGISALIGFENKVSFEGEAAIYLQNICDTTEKGRYTFEIVNKNEIFNISYKNIIKEILLDINLGVNKEIISMKFHNTIVEIVLQVSVNIRKRYKINSVVLSGGVFQNEILYKGIVEILTYEKFDVYTHGKIPCNDSGVSIGQMIIANEILK